MQLSRNRAVTFLVVAACLVCHLSLLISGQAQSSNGVLREVYLNIDGNTVSSLTSHPNFPDSPSLETIQPTFEAPAEFAESYGQRMRALVVAPQNGAYSFWIACDDNGALYLSTTESPAQKVQIATVNSWTSSREWIKEPNQHSTNITLVAGQRYYIEALQKEGGGGDNLAVRWQLPNAVIEEPIPNHRLIVYGLGPPVISQQPANVTVVEGGSATFTTRLQRMIGASFQWRRNGTNIPGATNFSYTLGPVSLADSNSVFSCAVTNAYGGTNSGNALLTVLPDVTRPTISTVGNLGEPDVVFVVFSEPVEPASATNVSNYTVNNGIGVLRAAFGVDARTVILTTTPIPTAITNTITVNNVRDRATTPNAIAANTQRTFSLSVRPIDVSFLWLPREPLGPSSRRHGVVISEVMYHPTNRTDGRNLEFIEIYNSQPWFEELGGWRISGAIDYVFPSNVVLQARSFLVVAASPADFRSVYSFANVFGPFLGSNGLQNSSGTLRLRNKNDAVVFEMNYTGDPPYPVAADGAGHSLVLGRPSYGERDPRAWVASDGAGGNPGTADNTSVTAYRTVVINELLAHTDEPQQDFIELYNHGHTAVTISGCILTDDPGTNKFVIPPNTTLAPRSFIAFTDTQLGFALSAGGESIFFKQPGGQRVLDAVRFDAQENGVALGRFPDGATRLTRLATPTPGTNNARFKPVDVVINEIMYDPVTSNSEDEYLELFNRGTNAVDLSGWRLRDAVSFDLPDGTILGAGGYLVIAKNAVRLRGLHQGLTPVNCLGDFDGALANGGERIELNKPDELVSTNASGQLRTNIIHVTVDEVTYGSGGRWGPWAAGGGSSLELLDARADHRLAPNWADSDESTKSPWVTVEATGVMDNGWADATQLHVTLLGAGEALVDNIEVIPAGRTNVIGNGTFEQGVENWVFQGNHNQTGWEPSEGFASARSLHLRATGRGDTGSNRTRTQLPFTLTPGTTVTLRAKVRWLKGSPNVLLRLRGNWMEAPGYVLAAKNLGTPGASNSRVRVNVGPAITDVRHDPPLPGASQPVLVTARVNDPDGLAYLAVNYRIDPSTNFQTVAMTNNGAGLFSTVIPGQAAGASVAFFVQAADNFTPPASRAFPSGAPARECVVRWGDNAIPGTLGTYRFWITQTNVDKWSLEERMSNSPKDITFIYGTNRIIYNAGGWYHGSPYHSPGYNSPVGVSCDYDLGFPEDERLLGETDINLFRPGNGGGDGTAQAEIHGYWFGGQFGVPFLYHRPVFVFVNGQRRETVFHDAQQPNGDFVEQWFPDDTDGDLHKIQLGFEFGDQAYGASEAGYAVVGANLARYTTTGGMKKQARYRQTWPRRSAAPQELNDYTNIYNLVEVSLTNAAVNTEAYTATLNAAVDVEEWFKVHVTQHLYNNPDSFSYGGGQNAFAYKPVRDTWKLFLWDIDFAFGGSATDANLTGIGGADHGPRNTHAPFARIYWQALIEAANGMMTPQRSDAILDARYNGMVAGGAAVGSPAGIKSFISTRRAYILQQVSLNQAPFTITSNGGADFSTNRNLISLSGTAPLEVRHILINGVPYPVTWTSLSNWVIRVPLASGTNTLAITGINPKGVPVAGVSGIIRVNYTGVDQLPQDRVVINEIMYHPVVPDASYVEIYNTSVSNAFDLSGWRLSGVDFHFPNGTVLNPGAFLMVVKEPTVFTETYGVLAPIAGAFQGNLDNGGETLTLFKPGPAAGEETIIDQVTYDDDLPWSPGADGEGPSLQLIDPLQDNNRSANWAAFSTNLPPAPLQWRFASVTGAASSSRLYVYLQSAGDLYIDDLAIVPGTVPGSGVNSIQNGDFEAAFPGPWNVSSNLSNSSVSTDIRHSGNTGLHLVFTSPGISVNSSLWQDVSPALTNGQTYTLSFWYRQSTNGGPFTVRLSGSALTSTVNPAPSIATNLARYTPGTTNSVRATLVPFPALWLNEVLPNNFFLGTNGVGDRFGERDPWVELYNGGTNTITLGGYYLANNYTNLAQWAFPPGASIGPKQFLLVWLDGEPGESTANEFHTSFRASGDIGSIVLSTGGGLASVVDHLNYDVPVAGRSYGSYPDGAVGGRRLFSIATPGATNNPSFPPIDVRINEWMADNFSAEPDTVDGSFEDWFELYNPGANVVDLSGYYLSESLSNATQWAIPAGTTIPAGGYLLVWADGEPGQNSPDRADLHADFALSKSGEAIGLFAPDGTVIDAISFGAQTTDVSQGRLPDGGATIMTFSNATPRAANFVPAPNTAPVLGFIADKTANEVSPLVFTVVATDADLPPQVLTYALDPASPQGATIHATNGTFSWTPGEDQGPGVHVVTIRVSDNGTPGLGTEQSFVVMVNEVNNAPQLAQPLSRNVVEGSLLTVTNAASDSDPVVSSFTFSLDPGAPPRMTIHPTTGVLTWTPAEAEGPGNYSIVIRVTDDGTPPLSDTKSFSVFVAEANTAPMVPELGDQFGHPGMPLAFAVQALDEDLPEQSLTFSLEPGAPPEATIDAATGWFEWTPDAGVAFGTNTVAVRVTDGGSPSLSTTRTFRIIVRPAMTVLISRTDDSVVLTATATIGRSYRAEFKTQLTDANWTPLGASEVAASSSVTFMDILTSNEPQRFYRVVQVD